MNEFQLPCGFTHESEENRKTDDCLYKYNKIQTPTLII